MIDLPCPSKRIASTAAYTSSGESWSSGDCISERKSGRYADYYTFKLDSAETVVIDLDSSLDNFLYLTKGPHGRGELVDFDRRAGPGNDAQIQEDLVAGIYTIEATIYPSGKRPGSYTLKVKELSCENPTNFRVARTGAGTANLTWTAPTDGITPTGYYVSVYRHDSVWVQDDTLRPSATATSFSDSGLVGNTSYAYKIWTQCGPGKYSSGSDWVYLGTWTGGSRSSGSSGPAGEPPPVVPTDAP